MTLYKNILFSFLTISLIVGCRNQWEEHIKVQEDVLGENVLQQVRSNPNLSQFYEYLVKTELDKVLISSKTFTIWAPDNEALQNLDQSMVNDPEELKFFIANHISYQQYFTYTSLPLGQRVQTLNGKYLFWDKFNSLVGGASIKNADNYSGNGVLHIIDAPIQPKKNSWEYLISSGIGFKQKDFMLSLNYETFVDSLATQIGVDPIMGTPIYEEGTGLVQKNVFFEEAYDLSSEDSLYTFIILTDAAFEAEIQKFKTYYFKEDMDSATYFTSWAIAKDLAFKGEFYPDALPDTLISRSGVKVGIDKNAIEFVESTSNGIVYILNWLDIKPKDKLLPIRIEGEDAYPKRHSVISHADKASNISLRSRRNGNEIFEDILARNHGVSGFNIKYTLDEVYSTKFKVYWVAYNDFNVVSNEVTPFQQKVTFKDPLASDLPYIQVLPYNLEKVYLGEYTMGYYGALEVFLVGDASTNNALNPLVLDYIEMVPVL